MAANQVELGKKVFEFCNPHFAELGLALDSLVVENLSLPEELQKMLDTRIGMNMIGNMQQYTQFQVANSIPIAAANEGGGAAGIGAGLGAGMAMANAMMGAINPAMQAPQPPAMPAAAPVAAAPVVAGAAPGGETKFCMHCGNKMPRVAKFCSECGQAQA
jgi:membrane protease subunit (stomatin/prohibitin family)